MGQILLEWEFFLWLFNDGEEFRGFQMELLKIQAKKFFGAIYYDAMMSQLCNLSPKINLLR